MKIFGAYSRPLKYIFESYKNHKMVIFISFLVIIFESVFSLLLPILAKLEMDQLAEKNEQLFGFIETSSFNIFIIILIIIFIGQFINRILEEFLNILKENYIKKFENEMQENAIARLKNMEIGLALNIWNERFLEKTLGQARFLPRQLKDFITDFFSQSIKIIGILTVFLMIDWRVFVVLIIATILDLFLQRYIYRLHEAQFLHFEYKNDYQVRAISGTFEEHLPQLVSSGGFNSQLTHLKDVNTHRLLLKKKYQKKTFFHNILGFILGHISEIFIKIIVGFSVFTSTTSLGTMTMTLLYIEKIESFLRFIAFLPRKTQEILDDLAQFDIFLEITEEKENKNISEKKFTQISFQDVSFSYPKFAEIELKFLKISERRMRRDWETGNIEIIEETRKKLNEPSPYILKNISMVFETGKTYGIVGKNGAGKTTIVSLLQNFFENYSGKILIDNEEIRKFSRDFFDKNISMIHQIPYLTDSGTIRENLMLGVEKTYSDEEIFKILKIFGIDAKIKKHRKWLDAIIRDDIDFSGWEKQLIVLARIILQDKKILIMDEWTNQLDAENEMLVMNELLKHKKDKIVIFITHRMTTIRKVDKIYTLKDGKIEASGTHDELIGDDNMYNFFWKTQVEV